MSKFLIEEQLAQNILNYLAEKPYKETAGLIQGLARLEKYEPPKVEESEPKEQPDEPEPVRTGPKSV